MNIKDILAAYAKVGIKPRPFTQEQYDLLQARSFAQSAIRKAGCSIEVDDNGIEIIGGSDKAWYVQDPDLDVAYQTALEKISEKGK